MRLPDLDFVTHTLPTDAEAQQVYADAALRERLGGLPVNPFEGSKRGHELSVWERAAMAEAVGLVTTPKMIERRTHAEA